VHTVAANHEAGALWSSVLEALANRLSTRRRAGLSSGTRCLGLDGSTLRVTAHTSDLAGWVRAGIIARLEQALESVSDGVHALAIVPVEDHDPLDRDPYLDLGSFISSPINAEARDAIRDFASGQSDERRLLILGPSGSGKSHLLRSAANWLETDADRVRVYSTEALCMELVQAIWNDDLDTFRSHLRDGALLAVDGIEALEGRDATQEELARALHSLDERGVPALLSSSRPLERLALGVPVLQQQLASSRILRLEAPEWETRVAIVLERTRRWGVATSPEVASFLAAKLRSKLDRLDATLTALLARCASNAELTDVELVRGIVDGGTRRMIRVSPDAVIGLVSRHFDVRLRDLRSSSRSPRVTLPRQIAMYLVRRHCGLSYPEIGRRFARHHTTAIHSDREIQRKLDQTSSLRSTVVLLEKELLRLSERGE
jgi:chromosomal replication initiator protein